MRNTTSEGNGSGALTRRLILVLTVATLMVAMLTAIAAPAFAGPGGINPRNLHFHCTNSTGDSFFVDKETAQSLESQGFTCVKEAGKIRF